MDLSRDILRDRHRLSHRQIDDFLGEETVGENRGDRLREMQRIGSFLEVAKILDEENIWFVNLKGPLLSERIYGDPTYRSFRDFDILVKPKDLNRVLYLLGEHGYAFRKFKWPQSSKRQRIARYFLNQIEMFNSETGITLEIHWKLFSARITEEKTMRRLIRDNVEQVDFGGHELNVFSAEFELFYLVVHGSIHAWFRLKWLVDIHEYLHRITVDWETFNRMVSNTKAQKPVDICNIMLGKYFPDEKRLPMAGTNAGELASIALEQSRQPEGDPHKTRQNTLKLLRYRMKLFPSRRYKMDVMHVITFNKMDLKYKWLPPYKYAYYLFRPFGWLLRGLKILN